MQSTGGNRLKNWQSGQNRPAFAQSVDLHRVAPGAAPRGRRGSGGAAKAAWPAAPLSHDAVLWGQNVMIYESEATKGSTEALPIFSPFKNTSLSMSI